MAEAVERLIPVYMRGSDPLDSMIADPDGPVVRYSDLACEQLERNDAEERADKAESERDKWTATSERATDLAEQAANLMVKRTAERDQVLTALEELADELENDCKDPEGAFRYAACLTRKRIAHLKGEDDA